MGGAQAGISALDLAIRTKNLRIRDQPVFAIGIASAIPGSKGFCQSMEHHVKPHGGLRIENYGDVVTFLGYGKATARRSKRVTYGFEMYGLQFLAQLHELYLEKDHHLTDLDMKISVSEKMTDLLQVELAGDTDDLQTVTSNVSSFIPWQATKSPQTGHMTQVPRYVRAKSRLKLTTSGSGILDENSNPKQFDFDQA
eukprot:s522_g4.t1